MVAALFFFYEFMQLNIFDPISQDLATEFGISTTKLGYMSSMYFYGNVMMVVPAGMLLDRFSTKLLIFIAMTACTVATFIFAQTHSFYIASVCRLFEGMGAGFCFLSALRLASRWFSANHLAFVVGVIVTWAMIGGMVAQTPMAILTEQVGWRTAITLDGFLGIFVIVLVLLIVKDRPDGHKDEVVGEQKHLHDMGVLKSLWFVVTKPYNWFAGLYTTLMNLPIWVIGALWGILYFQQAHGLDYHHASYITSMVFVGVIFGSPAFGWFSDAIKSRRIPMIVGALTSLIVMLIMLFVPHLSVNMWLVLSFLLGFLTSSQVVSYPVVAELNPIELTGSATSIVSLTIMISGVIIQPLTGWLIQMHWDKTMSHGHPVYMASDFFHAMIILPIAMVISFGLCFLIKETGCKSEYKHLR